MKLALLGADADTLAISAAIAARPQDQLVAICECPTELAAPLAKLGLAARQFDSWEALLDANVVDAVIVAPSGSEYAGSELGGIEERRAEQLRKFAQVGMPVLVTHPLFSSMLVYYELDMIRRDTNSILIPYLFERRHPAIVELARLCQSASGGAIGQIEQLVFERHLLDRGKAAVVRQFARDVDLLRAVGGEVARIHAMGPSLESTSYGNLSVQMSGASSLLARWSVAPAEERPWGRLTLIGSSGRAVVTMPAGQTTAGQREQWAFELSVAGGRLDRQLDGDWNPADAALDALAQATRGGAVKPDWLDAARSAELAETIGRSLKRGRTIELNYEEYSEASTFKGLMSAVGCSLLIVGLILVVVVGVLEDFLRRHVPLVPRWPYLLLGLLGFFLLLQLLLLALKREPSAAEKSLADRSAGENAARGGEA